MGLSVGVVVWGIQVVRGGPWGVGVVSRMGVVGRDVVGRGQGRMLGGGGGGVVAVGMAAATPAATVGMRGVHLCHLRHAGERGDRRHGTGGAP